MPDRQGRVPAPRRLDRLWLKSLGFTLALVSLVAVAVDADWGPTLVMLGICAVVFGFFYMLFPGGAQFGITIANFLAIYTCMFVFFRDANFPGAPNTMAKIALALPVLGFLAACFLRRRAIAAIIHARRTRALTHLPPLASWFLGAAVIGAASFAVPRLKLEPWAQGVTLLLAQGVITLVVMNAVRDVVLVIVDITMIFEGVAARLDRLVMPMLAFLSIYAVLIVVFASLYRIADLTTDVPQFALHGQPGHVGFIDALYYSVATITTLGYGDIAPASVLVRALSGLEVVAGILMLLFGFSEIMRNAGPDSGGPNNAGPNSTGTDNNRHR